MRIFHRTVIFELGATNDFPIARKRLNLINSADPSCSQFTGFAFACATRFSYSITLPSHENFPEMFVSQPDITTCVAFDKVVCENRRREVSECIL